MRNFIASLGAWTDRLGRAVAVVATVLIAGGAAAWLASASGGTRAPAAPNSEKKEPEHTTALRRVGPDEVVVPPEMQTALGLKTAPVAAPTRTRNLPSFQGTLNFDSTRLARVQSPFAGPVVDLGQQPIPPTIPPAPSTPVRDTTTTGDKGETQAVVWRKVGDKVTKGDVLAVVWSADLGAKKSEFVDALSKLKVDEKTYQRQLELFQEGGTAERTVREAERTVQADRVAADKAEATLRAWRLAPEELDALRAEADRLSTASAKRTDPARWARVEVKAPLSGVILEKNVANGQLVDTTTDLFRIGDLSVLAVWVHVYEEDLPLLRAVPVPTPWVVSVPALPGVPHFGRLEQIGAALDPAQHTALVTGTVENGRGDLRAGMSVTVAIELPPATGEVEVPAEAVIEDGRESFVFVRADSSSGDRFVRRPVSVIRRSRDVIAVAERAGGLKPGDVVVTAGSLLLGDAFTDLPQPK